jgi:hypothetical protein
MFVFTSRPTPLLMLDPNGTTQLESSSCMVHTAHYKDLELFY